MRRLISVVLVLAACASVAHKPLDVVDLKDVIERVETDNALPQDKKNYYLAELKQAQSSLGNKANYIYQLETDKAEQQKQIDLLKTKIESLSESKGRIKQLDYQFWGFVGLCVLALIGVGMYIFIKFGNMFNPQRAAASAGSSLATELIRKQAGL
jgi:hypothetical protein